MDLTPAVPSGRRQCSERLSVLWNSLHPKFLSRAACFQKNVHFVLVYNTWYVIMKMYKYPICMLFLLFPPKNCQ